MSNAGTHMEAAAPLRQSHRPLRAVCFAVPAAILVLSWLWLALDHRTPALWNVIVHESGRYTMAGTILYFSHFLREIPTDVAYALFILAAVGAVPGAGRSGNQRRALVALGAATLLVLIALMLSVREQGWSWALRDLFQMRTRDDLIAYGSHWRFHWLSTLWFGVAALLIAPLLVRAAPAPAKVRVWIAWGYFALLTLIFGMSGEIFTDVRYTGHQAREIMTHGPITGLLALGVVQIMTGDGSPVSLRSWGAGRRWTRAVAAALFIGIPLYLAAVTLAGDAMAAGQSGQGLAAMVAGHVFEHVLDYLLVVLLVAGGSALPAWRQR